MGPEWGERFCPTHDQAEEGVEPPQRPLRQWWLEPQQEQPCNMGPAVEDQHKQCLGPRQANGKASVPVWHDAKPEYVINTTPARDPGVNQELFLSLPVSTSFSFC